MSKLVGFNLVSYCAIHSLRNKNVPSLADPRKPKPQKPSNRTRKAPTQSVQETEEPIDDDALNNLVRFKIDPDDFPDGIDWSTQTW